MSRKISWTQDWDPQDYTGFSLTQKRNAMRIYKNLAVILIEAKIKSLRKKRKITHYTTSWKNDNGIYLFNTYITPPAAEIQKGRSRKKGIGGSTVTPAPPPKP